MKKSLTIVALLAVLLITTSGLNDGIKQVSIGDIAPEVNVKSSTSTAKLSNFTGHFTVISFWSSEDAESRRLCNVYQSWINAQCDDDDNKVSFVAVNFDANRELFAQIVANDGLNCNTQINVSGDDARVIREAYGLDGKLGSILVDPAGRIVSVNPSPEFLSSI